MRLSLFLLFLPSAFGISFAEYAFWFPDVADNVILEPCRPLEKAVLLTPAAAQKPGFATGVKDAVQAVNQFKAARQWAMVQASPILWGQYNQGGHFLASTYCHRHAAQGLRLAMDAINQNWAALDAAIADIEFVGVQNQGPTGRVFFTLQEARQHIESRDTTTGSMGSRFVRALHIVQEAVETPGLMQTAATQLIGPNGLLEAQMHGLTEIQEAKEAVQDQYRRLSDEVTQRLQDARRLQSEIDDEKIFLVPENAFALTHASFTQTGTVQTFPTRWRQSRNALEDGVEEQKNAQRAWRERERGYGGRALRHLHVAREHAEKSVLNLQTVKREAQDLETDLVRTVDALRRDLEDRRSDDAVLEYRRQKALQNTQQPLAATSGKRILQLVQAHEQLQDVRQRMASFVDETPMRRELERVNDMITRAEQDGLKLGAEKQRWSALEAISENPTDVRKIVEDLDALYGEVVAAAQDRFATLPSRHEALFAYEPFIALPEGFDENHEPNWAQAIGSLKSLSDELAKREFTVQKNRRTWLLEHLEKNRRVRVTSTAVRADRPSPRIIEVTYTNDLDFGDESALFLSWPEAVPKDAELLHADKGLRVLSNAILLEHVQPHAAYTVAWQENTTRVRTLTWMETTTHASATRIRREVAWTFSSAGEGPVQLEHDFGFDVTGVTGLVDAVVNQGILFAVVSAAVGKNTVHFSYAVEQPVGVTKHGKERQWEYRIKNRLPFAFSLPVEFQEITACPVSSTDFATIQHENAWVFSANVTLEGLEEKTLYAELDCAEQSLSNQSRVFSSLPTLSADQKRVLKEAEDALLQGKSDEAAWWLFQLQAPVMQTDPLADARRWAEASETAKALFSSVEAAWRRGDRTAMELGTQQLKDHVENQKTAVKKQLDALCTRCPADVEKMRAEAENYLFTQQIQKAQDALARAKEMASDHQTKQKHEAEELAEVLGALEQTQWPQRVAYETAFEVPASLVNWRGRQPHYQTAKKSFETLEKKVAQLDQYRQQVAEGKSVTSDSVRLVLGDAQKEAEKLGAAMDESQKKAEDAVAVAEKTLQQFGSDADKNAFKEAENALAENRFALAQYAAEQVTRRTQKNPATTHAIAEPGTIAVGVGAVVVLGALAYHFRKPEKPLEEL